MWSTGSQSTLTALYGLPPPPTLEDVVIIRGFAGRERLFVVAVTVILVTALALILAVQGYHTLLEETFRERSVAYAQAFAASAGAWVEPLNADMLRAASRFMLVGSALYVQIELDGTLIIDERGDEASTLDLPSAISSPSLQGETGRLPSGASYLDVAVPLAVSGETAGSVRIGIDTVAVVARGRSMALAASGIAILVDALVLGLLFWSHRGRTGRRETAARVPARSIAGALEMLVVGDLRIDLANKEARLKGRRVELTPKQFTLLAFLAERPDRVVSEEEIVESVWSDSPYADSKDVKQYVYLVRKRLAKADPNGRELIVTVPGFGYRLGAD